MKAIDLRFGSPAHGWLEVTLTGAHGTSSFEASDVPGDSLRILAGAACDLLDGRDGEVTWFLEPAEQTWRFVIDGEEVRVLVSEDGRPARKLAQGTVVEVGLAVWRALRRLEADPAWRATNADTVWSHSFPQGDVAALGEKLGRSAKRSQR